jgi:mono-ADP-ribosyltransferase sirtuin 6
MEQNTTEWLDFVSPIPQKPETGNTTSTMKLIENMNDDIEMVKRIPPNQILIIRNCKDSDIVVPPNERIRQIIIDNCIKCCIQILDSCTIHTRSVQISNVTDCEFLFDEVDLRKIVCDNVKNSSIQFSDSPTLLENFTIVCKSGCSNVKIVRAVIVPEPFPKTYRVYVRKIKEYEAVGSETSDSYSIATFNREGEVATKFVNEQEAMKILADLTYDPIITPPSDATCISEQESDLEIREYLDHTNVLLEKVKQVANIIKNAKHVVFYTGAGISTSASIPDYRGPNGLWTVKSRGEKASSGLEMITQALPTYSHYAITELMRRNMAHFVSSTNMDGLHRRSGVTRENISELHGNSYKEICYYCIKEYLRGFDVTDTVENYLEHYTGRICSCGGDLKDTINHFTEPMNENELGSATENAWKSDVSIVMGTTMRVHPAASLPEKALRNGGSLVIVNLQYTPYDNEATVKIHAKTDNFMELLMKELGIEEFDRTFDILQHLNDEDNEEGNNDEEN